MTTAIQLVANRLSLKYFHVKEALAMMDTSSKFTLIGNELEVDDDEGWICLWVEACWGIEAAAD